MFYSGRKFHTNGKYEVWSTTSGFHLYHVEGDVKTWKGTWHGLVKESKRKAIRSCNQRAKWDEKHIQLSDVVC